MTVHLLFYFLHDKHTIGDKVDDLHTSSLFLTCSVYVLFTIDYTKYNVTLQMCAGS